MDLDSLRVQLRRAEFNRTEAETATALTEEAIRRGDEAREEHHRLSEVASQVSRKLEEGGWFDHLVPSNDDLLPGDTPFCGLDGSFFALPSGFDLWYVPISVAKVRQRFDFAGSPDTSVEARIDSIRLPPTQSVFRESGLRMLSLESRALLLEASNPAKPRIFMDGPIADPPFYAEEGYVTLRTDAIKRCLEHELSVLGCVKRISDRYLPSKVGPMLDDRMRSSLDTFPNDFFLITHAFAKHRSRRNYHSALLTPYIDISQADPTHRKYWEMGVGTICGFYQRDSVSRIARIDVPFLRDSPDENSDKLDTLYRSSACMMNQLTLPGQSYPVPVMLAHEKCKVRQGAAEVLYLEIMTKSATVSPEDFTTLMQLR